MRTVRTFRKASLLLLILLFASQALAGKDAIREVTVDKTGFDYLVDTAVSIGWELSAAMKLNLYICDLNGNIVHTLVKNEKLPAGSHSVSWDGLDKHGDRLADGVYFPVIKGRVKGKGSALYTPTSLPWGMNSIPEDIEYDGEAVTFQLNEATFGRLRVGLKEGGPVYRTLAPWQLWLPGQHAVPWNGKDQEDVNTVVDNNNFGYSFDAFTLPENSIVITGGDQLQKEKAGYRTFPIQPPTGANASYFALTPTSLIGEPKITAQCGNKKKTDWQCTVDFAEPGKKSGYIPPGSELLVYLDDEFVIEFPVDKIPTTVAFDVAKYDKGSHMLTLNLLTHDDRAGIAMKKIQINN